MSNLVYSEWSNRKNRAAERAVRAAQFRYNVTLAEVDLPSSGDPDRFVGES